VFFYNLGAASKVLFSEIIRKYDRRFHDSEFKFIITESHIFLISTEISKNGPEKGKPVEFIKRKLDFSQLSSVSLSTLQDDFLVLHILNDYDIVFEQLFKTEIVTVLSTQYSKLFKKPLKINFSDR
jgi:myosin-1